MMTEKGFMTRLEDVLKKFNGITDILRFFQRLPEVAVMIRNALRSIHSLIEICQDCNSKSAMLGQFCQVKSN